MLSLSEKAGRGQAVGLLGGSFDPAHEGHVQITREALRRFGLDRVWWLVSPGNPLKPEGPAPVERRMEVARRLMAHPRVEISDFEARAGTRYTAETLAALMRRRPDLRFVWLMGADNLASFHRWQNWQWIMENVPIGVIARPEARIPARNSVAARRYGRFRLPGRASVVLPRMAPPAWCFINVPMVEQSSSAIRQRGEWSR